MAQLCATNIQTQNLDLLDFSNPAMTGYRTALTMAVYVWKTKKNRGRPIKISVPFDRSGVLLGLSANTAVSSSETLLQSTSGLTTYY